MHPILKEMAKLNQMNHPQKGLYFCPLLIHLDQIMESFLIRSPEYTHTEACTSIHTFFIFCIFQKKKTHQNLKLLHVQLDYVERSHSKLILCLSILPLTMCHTKLIFAGFLCAIIVMNFIDIKTTPLSSENKLSVSQASSFPAALKWGEGGAELRLLNSLQ